MTKVLRDKGVTTIEMGPLKIKTNKINRGAYNRLRKEAQAGTIKPFQVAGALQSKQD